MNTRVFARSIRDDYRLVGVLPMCEVGHVETMVLRSTSCAVSYMKVPGSAVLSGSGRAQRGSAVGRPLDAGALAECAP